MLQGLYWDEQMIGVDFDNVTPSLSDNLLQIWLTFHNDTVYVYDYVLKFSYPAGWVPYFHVSFRSSMRKCFTFDIPFMKNQQVHTFGLKVKNSFFSFAVS